MGLDVHAVIVHTFLFAGDVTTNAIVVVFIGLNSGVPHVDWSNLLQLLEDGRNSAVEDPDGFLRFLLKILTVGTDHLCSSFLVVGGQELSLDNVKLGEVLEVAEVLLSNKNLHFQFWHI